MNQRAKSRSLTSSFTSVLFIFEITSSVQSFTNFNFKSRLYEFSNQSLEFVFLISNRSESNSSRSNSTLDFIEIVKLSKLSQLAKNDTSNSTSAFSIKLKNQTRFHDFSSRSITTDSSKQTLQTTAKQNISKSFEIREQFFIAKSRASIFAINMTFNSRNAKFEVANTDESSENNN